MKHTSNNIIKAFAFWMLGALWAVSATPIYWKGEDGAYLNDANNWEGDAPFDGTSSNDMKFKDSPSKNYTVKLSDDLVSAGCWDFSDAPNAATLTWDLNGHTMTFLKVYSSHCHQGWTNIIENGTIAFTNAAGTIQTVNFWHAKSGYAMFVKGTGSFIGNFSFSDGGTKTLDVRDGAQWKGSVAAKGYRCAVTFTGDGTVANLMNGMMELGGAPNNENQAGEVMGYITDGAVVTNAAGLLVGGSAYQGYGGKCHLVISNATFSLAPQASSLVVVGGGSVNNVYVNNVLTGTAEHITSENVLEIVDGSKVDFANNRFSVGNSMWHLRSGGSGSHSNLVYIAGEDTVFTALLANADWPGVIGHNGCWNQLHLTDGAYMRTGYLCAGGQGKAWGDNVATSCWNRVTVDKGAFLDSSATLILGTRHGDDFANGRAAKALNASNVYEVVNGGKASAQGVTVGVLYCAKDNRFIVDGEGSALNLFGEGRVYVGASGSSGNGFEVTGGATLTGVKTMKIGEEVYYQGDVEKVGCTASNNYVRIEKTDVEGINTIEIGHYHNGGNTLWVGDGATVKTGGVVFRGFGHRLVVSNGLLRVALDNQGTQHGLRPAWTESGTYTTADYSGKHTFEFYEQGRIVNGKNMGCDFTNACKFVFHVPAKGYSEAALESTSAGLQFSDDTEFEFDFDAVSKDGLRNVPLLKYSGDMGEQYRIVMSDELLEKINAAAAKVREGSKVRLSSDRRELTLRVGSAGFAIIVR